MIPVPLAHLKCPAERLLELLHDLSVLQFRSVDPQRFLLSVAVVPHHGSAHTEVHRHCFVIRVDPAQLHPCCLRRELEVSLPHDDVVVLEATPRRELVRMIPSGIPRLPRLLAPTGEERGGHAELVRREEVVQLCPRIIATREPVSPQHSVMAPPPCPQRRIHVCSNDEPCPATTVVDTLLQMTKVDLNVLRHG